MYFIIISDHCLASRKQATSLRLLTDLNIAILMSTEYLKHELFSQKLESLF
jgi:hypothetical protein